VDILPKLIDYLAATQFHDLPKAVVDSTKKFIVDSIGVTIAGSNAPGCREVVNLIKGWGGKPEATIVIDGTKVPTPWAAMANSMLMHALDFDDTLDESALHAHVSVLPSAMAAAEAVGNVTGKNLINAVALGVDVVCRLGLSTNRPLSWIRTATCGTFGATVAAAKIMGLDKSALSNAMGICYSQVSGNAQCLIDGGLVKRIQPAFSAKSGVLSALMAQNGITGAKDFLEGPYGFFNLYESGDYKQEILVEDLGKVYGGTKLSIKPYPSCRMTHASIDAALAIRRKLHIEPSHVKEVSVHVSKMAQEMVGKPFIIRENPQVDAQFSIPYTVATALLNGDVFLNDFEEQAIRKAQATELAKKIKVFVNPHLHERDMSNANLLLKYKGAEYSKKIDTMKGSPANPMTLSECVAKFKKCVAYTKHQTINDKAEQILECLVNLENMENAASLMSLLG
jgi:2-methylcitrate dehydratase PrpD